MKKSDWKTKTTAILTVLAGIIGVIINFLDPSNPNGLSIQTGIATILLGLGGFGFADKFQKFIDTLKK